MLAIMPTLPTLYACEQLESVLLNASRSFSMRISISLVENLRDNSLNAADSDNCKNDKESQHFFFWNKKRNLKESRI